MQEEAVRELVRAAKELHGIAESLANAYAGYLPYKPQDNAIADIKTRIAFITDSMTKADKVLRRVEGTQ